MRVLVACEFSGIVRESFRRLGHDAVSVDLLLSERRGPHIQGDALEVAYSGGWDLMIAHPPCTYLAISARAHFAKRQREQRDAVKFVLALMRAPIPLIAVENPISVLSSHIRKPDQIIQPWMFGHGESKSTCLWLKGLPKLVPTNIVDGRMKYINMLSPDVNRWKARSRTHAGIARAMAAQWGGQIEVVSDLHIVEAS